MRSCPAGYSGSAEHPASATAPTAPSRMRRCRRGTRGMCRTLVTQAVPAEAARRRTCAIPATSDLTLTKPYRFNGRVGRDLLGPLLHRRALHLLGPAAGPAHQVMVVLAAVAAAVELLAVGQAHLVDLTGVGEDLQGPVHRGQAHPGTGGPELGVQLLGTAELVGTVEQRQHFGPLAGVAGHARRGTGHRSSSSAISQCTAAIS